MPEYSLTVNGRVHRVNAAADTPLIYVLRNDLRLMGTRLGCGIAQCGACSIHLNGAVTRSCVLPLAAVGPNDKITTIEGLSSNGSHPVQKAWKEIDVPQCGYCQSGQIMAAAALIAKHPEPTDAQINEEMTNICRCGTYNRIRAAIKQAAAQITKKA